MIEENIYPPDLRPWKPVSTVPPEEWMALFRELEFTTRGTPRQYILDAKYDAQGVGDQLCEWGLPWHVVMAGYLWEYSEEQIRQIHLEGVELVLSHIKESITYANYIETENLRPLLVPPYNDMGALLVAVAIYYRTLSILQKRSNGHPY